MIQYYWIKYLSTPISISKIKCHYIISFTYYFSGVNLPSVVVSQMSPCHIPKASPPVFSYIDHEGRAGGGGVPLTLPVERATWYTLTLYLYIKCTALPYSLCSGGHARAKLHRHYVSHVYIHNKYKRRESASEFNLKISDRETESANFTRAENT